MPNHNASPSFTEDGREKWDSLAQEEVAQATSGDYSQVRPLHEELGLAQSDVDEVDAETLRGEPPYDAA